MGRSGTAKLPLHSGNAPSWLFSRMEELGEAISEVIIEEYGQKELLSRLSDPYWFQAFGCVLGFDWHSSGLTTTTMGALKESLSLEQHGIKVAGGKGSVSRKTPEEIEDSGLRTRRIERLKEISMKSASVDSCCVQDSYTLYHHTTVFTEKGEWCVIQQGMNSSHARRYHWSSESVESPVEEPHEAICSEREEEKALNLVSTESSSTRETAVDLVNDNPAHLHKYFTGQRSLKDFGRELKMPDHHLLRSTDLTEKSLNQLQKAYEVQPEGFDELLEVDGVGKKSIRALALVSELIHGTESDWKDPAKYAYAHGGKDGTPYPVDRERYDRSIEHLKEAVEAAEIDSEKRKDSLKRLGKFFS